MDTESSGDEPIPFEGDDDTRIMKVVTIDELIDDDDADYLEKHYQHEQVQLREELFTTPSVLSFLDEEHESPRLINQPNLVNDCRRFVEQIEKRIKSTQMVAKSREFYPIRLQDKIESSRIDKSEPHVIQEKWPTYNSSDIEITLESIGLYIENSFCNERYPFVHWRLLNAHNATIKIGEFYTWSEPDGTVDISFIKPQEFLIHDPSQPTG